MAYNLEQFSAECHRILAADPGVKGREKICALVQDVLKDEDFVAANLGDDVPERKVLYEDPDLGFCIMSITTPRAATRTITARPGRSMARRVARR
jgi:hypothetical protein